MIFYSQFFKDYVLRKRNELLAPRFHPSGEVLLPKASLIHYLPRHANEYGPPVTEPFISNFPKEIFIDFKLDFTPVIGHGRVAAFDKNKAIKAYRNSHYNYSWTRNMSSVYNREAVLVVKNYGLMEQGWAYRPSLFVNFERYYNRMHMLMTEVEHLTVSTGSKRKQFIRMEMPIRLPNYKEFLIDYSHYKKCFNEEGLPVITKQPIRTTKGENCYWLLDWYAYLIGDYEYSQFSKLGDKATDDFHIMFTSNSKTLIVNLGLLKSWFDGVDKKRNVDKDGVYEPSSKRLNVTKRFYLTLMNLVRGSVVESEIVGNEKDDEGIPEENTIAGGTQKGRNSSSRTSVEESEPLDGGAERDRDEDEGEPVPTTVITQTEDVSSSTQSSSASTTPSSILDLFTPVEDPDTSGNEEGGVEGSGDVGGSPEDWTAEVDDELLDEEAINHTETDTKKDVFETPVSGIESALNERAKNGVLTVAEQNFFLKKANRYKEIKMNNGQTMDEFVKITEAELSDMDSKIQGNFTTVLDESLLSSKANILKTEYPKKFLQKDIAKCVLQIQNAGIALNDFKHERIENVEGSYDVYHLQFHPVNGSQSTRPIRLPTVQSDGTFMVDGVKQHLQLQRMELPIRKISSTKVALTSYYDKKLMVSRSSKMADDYGRWLVKQIQVESLNGSLAVKLGNVFNPELKAPRIYSILAKKFSLITTKDYAFNFDFNKLTEDYPEFKHLNKLDKFLIGVKAGEPITIDSYGNVYYKDESVDTIEGLMNISIRKSPIEYCVMNINGYLFPIGVVLCYYFGIDQLLKVIKATTRTIPVGNRQVLTDDEFSLTFSDEYLVLNKRERLTALIFGGMTKLSNLSNFSRVDLNNKGVFLPLMGDAKVRPQHFLEMNNIYDLFIDPITKEELQRLGYSVSLHYLLIDAVKMLLTDYTRHEVELEEQRIVGYERFAGHVYAELCKSVRQYRGKGNDRRHTVDLNPESVIMNIITDTSVNLVEEVNPIHQLKDQEEVTFGGTRGRSEITMVRRARQQLKSYKGVISEANKDSGKVGFVTYMTSDPRIKDYRGNIDTKAKSGNAGLGSVTFNLYYGGNIDDAKRTSFSAVQASQAATANNYTPNILRTGYDNVIAHRTSELYSKVAQQDGKVTKVTPDALTVTYKDGTEDYYPLGLIIGEASGEYHRHTRITDLKEGDAFKTGDVIGWDEQWFERDTFCPGQVAWKGGRNVRLVLMEDQGVFEDSIEISTNLAKEFVTPFTKAKAFLMDLNQGINPKVKIGDVVDYDSILCEVEDAHLMGIDTDDVNALGVNRYGIRQIKSHHHGKIIDIKVTYNGQYEEMSESLSSYIKNYDKTLAKKAKAVNKEALTGNVSSSLTVKKESINPGKAKIVFYIESEDGSVMSDKYVVGNQMKGTVGGTFDKPMMTVDGREIDLKFSFKSLFNRMVLSLRNKMAVNEFSIGLTKKAIDIYRGNSK